MGASAPPSLARGCDIVRTQLAAGRSAEEIAVQLVSAGASPIAAIRALRNVAKVSLAEAKTCVDHSLSPEVQTANERLRDMAKSVAMLTQAMDHARCTAPGCLAPSHVFILYLADPGQGFHCIAPLTLEGACATHCEAVRERARASSCGWLEPGVVPVEQALDLLDWFYGSSGLSAGPRGFSVVTPVN